MRLQLQRQHAMHLRPRTSRRFRSACKVQAGAQSSTDAQTTVTVSSKSALTYTSYESNTFNMRFNASGISMLVDPWLIGDLTFLDQPALFRGKKPVQRQNPVDLAALSSQTDVVLITQGLPDHFHEPTLKALPKNLPIVGNPEAAEMARLLGFTDVKSVDHGETISICDGALQVTGTIGAVVGPPWAKRQNGYVMKEVAAPGGIRLYYEPHAEFDEASVAAVGSVDVLVTPVQSQMLNLGVASYELVKGASNLLQLLDLLKPKVVVALENANIEMEGLLCGLVAEGGTIADAQRLMAQRGATARLMVPTTRQPMEVTLE